MIDHAPLKARTFHAHLDKLSVPPTASAESKQRVRAGQMIGTVGFSPLDGEKTETSRFEFWLGCPTNGVDPALVMRGWEVAGSARDGGGTERQFHVSTDPCERGGVPEQGFAIGRLVRHRVGDVDAYRRAQTR